MKIPRSIFKTVAPLGLSLASLTASAATQLPYFGPDQKNCGVAAPAGPYSDYDVGFVSSEDCHFIYILPPKFGTFETRPVQYSVISQNICEQVNQAIKGLMTITATPGTPEYSSASARALAQVKNYKEQLKDAFPGVEAYASASASFDWNGLVQAYHDANPHLAGFAQFLAMPIRSGVLSMASAGATTGSLGEFENELYSVRVSSYQSPATAEAGNNVRLPSYLSFLDDNRTSFVMGQSVGLELRFGIAAACSLAQNAHPEQALSGTYTYVYPVQSKGLVRYEFNKDYLIPLIRDFITSRRDGFTTIDLANMIKEKQAFKIVINEGAFSDAQISDQLEEFKNDLAAKGTEIMLNLLASQSAISMAASTTVETTVNRQRECHGAWFWKHCNTRVWTTSRSIVDWNRFADDLTRNLAVPDVSAETYKTFYIMSTSAVVPKAGI
jgi:hypothetical protein